jgi:flagellar motor switch protein FliN
MHDDVITQAEIDALVRGMTSAPSPAVPPYGARLLAERSAKALAELIMAEVHEGPTETGLVEVANLAVPGGAGVIARVGLTGGDRAYWLVPANLATAVVTQLYGGVQPSALDDSALAALGEGLNQMSRAVTGALAGAATPPTEVVSLEALPAAALSEVYQGTAANTVWTLTFNLVVEGETGPVTLVLPPDLGNLVASLQHPATANPRPAPEVKPAVPAQGTPAVAAALAAAAVAEPPVKAVQFPDLTPRASRDELRNIDLLLDVSLQVTVELGRTRRQIRDVLSLGPGSVLELDKLAGEQVDVLINGKLIAKGEVVVIDENYGVRITDIVSPTERVQVMR